MTVRKQNKVYSEKINIEERVVER